LEAEGAIERDRTRKTWQEVVDTDMNDLHLKPNDDRMEGNEEIEATAVVTML